MLANPPNYRTGDHVGNYIVLEKMDDNPVFAAFSAVEPALDRHVIIKPLRGPYSSHPEQMLKFKDEGRRVASLSHKHIIPLYCIGQEEEMYYLAVAYIRGYNLQDWLNENRIFDPNHAMWFMTQVISALSYAAHNNVYHLDLKPISLVVDWDNILTIANIGVVQCHKLLLGQDRYDCLADPRYVTPEQIGGKAVDLRTDLYSLGAVLFHLMTGRLPFEAQTSDAVCLAHLQQPFPADQALKAAVPPGWVALMERLMEKDPKDRFQNYQELSEALIELV